MGGDSSIDVISGGARRFFCFSFLVFVIVDGFIIWSGA